jgi:hypothetical protein
MEDKGQEAMMAAATEIQIQETERERVEKWRAEALERVGYDSTSAALLATQHDVDLHLAIELVERGCPPEVAIRILL